MPILVTGVAGFIGHAVARRLLDHGHRVLGIDSLNAYYDPALKQARLATLASEADFNFHRLDIADAPALARLVQEHGAQCVVHLAAQAGVRHSIDHPFAYERSNLAGHLSVLEACRHAATVRHLVYASSSSVYGDRPLNDGGFREDDPVNAPVSLYAATKRSCELMSECYASLYKLPQTGLRFFTVYGPWGRPDMAPWLFTSAILDGRPIDVFNGGRMRRDFTYIDDIVSGVVAAIDRPPVDDGEAKPGGSRHAHAIYNIGNSKPERLDDFIAAIEQACGKQAVRQDRPMQPGDVPTTFADISAIRRDLGYAPTTPIGQGIPKFVRWYRRHVAGA
ncbi:NAD-dependent epimerase/dehydratase family protein [Sphingomonas turrisvirgatae]|uniref:Protein CapI n=1 Tax=Sphingomonas turrisvirgatae TaxID=1888892 RepID=A0A1E3LUQ0_9SPHN|nr:NAD-dependent epimerase/dehydratase family protein [Sphingomonas turrisvirgatae]ODP36550.1 protein CapI [Sphingomonas turrisvirgatae]